jgi:hypothetical protein
VHHGRNPKYIDRNHGGTLIVWDRLFGTYAREEDEPVYGITTPIRSWNPVWANLHYWVELWQKARRIARPADRVRLFLARPGWHPPELGGFVPAPEVDALTHRKWDTPLPRALGGYVLAQFAVVLVGAAVFLFEQDRVGAVAGAFASVAVAASLVILGALLEQKRWAFTAEAWRVAAAAAGAMLWAAASAGFLVLACGIAGAVALSSWWLARVRPTPLPPAPAR